MTLRDNFGPLGVCTEQTDRCFVTTALHKIHPSLVNVYIGLVVGYLRAAVYVDRYWGSR